MAVSGSAAALASATAAAATDALRPTIEALLLERERTISQVRHSEWAGLSSASHTLTRLALTRKRPVS